MRAPFAGGLETLRSSPAFAPFEIVLLDPPYAQPLDSVVEIAGTVVAPGGLVVLEHARRQPAPAAAPRLVRVREIRSGDSMLSLYENAEP